MPLSRSTWVAAATISASLDVGSRAASASSRWFGVMQVAPRVAGEIVAFRIDIDRHTAAAGAGDRGVKHFRREHPLAVIRQDHRVRLRDGALDRGEQRRLLVRAERVRVLLIDPHQLLVPGQIAGLARRRRGRR